MTPQTETVCLLEYLIKRQEASKYEFDAEHRAENVPDLTQAIVAYRSMGWTLIRQNDEVAFLTKDGHVTELVTGDTPPHYAYVVPEISHIDRIESTIRIFLLGDKHAEITNTGNVPGALRYIMVKCVRSGEHLQFIWRAEPLLPQAAE